MTRYAMVLAISLAASTSHAGGIFYSDETVFLANAGDVLFDSFEDLDLNVNMPTATPDREGYTISTSLSGNGYGLYVYGATTSFGSFATDGERHLVVQTDDRQTLRFDFDTPVNSFGFSLTDWDNPAMTTDALLVFGNDVGDQRIIAATPQAAGSQLFFSLVNTSFAFSWVEISNGASSEAFGIDGLYLTRPVPVPAALWLFGSALFGSLLSLRRRPVH